MSSRARWIAVALLLGAVVAACAPDPATGTPEAPPPPPPSAARDSVVKHLDILMPADPIRVGTTATLRFVARNTAGDTLPGAAVVWYSSDPTIASITRAGVITGVHAGTVTIVADAGTVAGTATARIAAVDTIPGNTPSGSGAHVTVAGPGSMYPGQSAPFTAVVYDGQGLVLPNTPVTWTSSDNAIATVSPSGVVQALAPGSVDVSATGGGARGSRSLTVTTVAAGRIQIDYALDLVAGTMSSVADLAPGQTYLLNASVFTSTGQLVTQQPLLTWQTDHPEIATVGPNGLVTAIADGRAVITASVGSLASGFTINVRDGGSGTATIRLVHATGEAGRITFDARDGSLANLTFGETSELAVPAGMIQMTLGGIAGNAAFASPAFQAFNGPLAPTRHYTFVAAGSGLYAPMLFPMLDGHAPIPAEQALVRIVMAGDYAANYYGNNIYFLGTGAPITTGGIVACYFDAPTATGYLSRPAGAFDIVIADAGYYSAGTQTTVPDVEAARFHVNPAPGRATTYVITGTTRASLGILTLVDP